MHVLLSIDPGKTGAVAVFEEGKLRAVHDPINGSLAEPFASELLDNLDFRYRVTVVIEKVNGVPGQSGPAAFNFGDGFGQLKGVCLGLGVVPILIPPAEWKWKMGLRGTGKSASLDLARSRWTHLDLFKRAKDDGRAEAALLGAYWLEQRQ